MVTLAGYPFLPRFSPDGTTLRFTARAPEDISFTLYEINVDGAGLHQFLPSTFHQDPGEWGGKWTPDGRYYLFTANRNGRIDIWALQEHAGLLRKRNPYPFPISNGPLSYLSPTPALSGNRVFAVGEQQRAELQRYDSKTKSFVPYLSGISGGPDRHLSRRTMGHLHHLPGEYPVAHAHGRKRKIADDLRAAGCRHAPLVSRWQANRVRQPHSMVGV